jgi:hypothetical protein
MRHNLNQSERVIKRADHEACAFQVANHDDLVNQQELITVANLRLNDQFEGDLYQIRNADDENCRQVSQLKEVGELRDSERQLEHGLRREENEVAQ